MVAQFMQFIQVNSVLIIKQLQIKKRERRMTEVLYAEFQTKYQFMKRIGEGGFGRISRIRDRKTAEQFVVKKILMRDSEHLRLAKNEIKMMSELPYPEVMKVHEYYIIYYTNSNTKSLYEVGIVMDQADGTMMDLVKQFSNNVPNHQIVRFMIQMAGLLANLQADKIAHRDIKPDNVLYFIKKDGSLKWKLADFGLALKMENNTISTQQFTGCYQFSSPKLKKKIDQKLDIQTDPYKDDVYSFGLTILQSITGSYKFTQQTYQKLAKKSNVDSKLLEIIKIMLQPQQQKRPCFKQLIKILQKTYPQYFGHQIPQNEIKIINKVQDMTEEKQNKKQQQTARKQIQYKQTSGSQNDIQKTIKKKSANPMKLSDIVIEKPISSVAFLQDKIICGTQDGQIIILNEHMVFYRHQLHKGAVTNIKMDDLGNIWSVGTDGDVYALNRYQLLRALDSGQQIQQNKQQIQQSDMDIQNRMQQQYPQMQRKQSEYNIVVKIATIKKHKGGISVLRVKDVNNFALGFYNGFVYIKSGDSQYHRQFHNRTVTGLEYKNGLLYTSGMDGQIRIINTQTMQMSNRVHIQYSGIVSLSADAKQDILYSTTLAGVTFALNLNLQTLAQYKVTSQRQCMCSQHDSKYNQIYLLTEQGIVLDQNQKVITNLERRGTTSMNVAEGKIVVGGYDGIVTIIYFKSI